MTEDGKTGLDALGLTKVDDPSYTSISAAKAFRRMKDLEEGDRVFLHDTTREYALPHEVQKCVCVEWLNPHGNWYSVYAELLTTDPRKPDPVTRHIKTYRGPQEVEVVTFTKNSDDLHSVLNINPKLPEK